MNGWVFLILYCAAWWVFAWDVVRDSRKEGGHISTTAFAVFIAPIAMPLGAAFRLALGHQGGSADAKE